MPDSDLTPGDVLKKLRIAKGLSRAELAKLIGGGTHHNTIQKLENSERRLTLEWIDRLSPHLGINREDFLSQLPHPEEASDKSGPADIAVAGQNFVPVGRYDASFSMGPGALIGDQPEPMGYWMVETQWLRGISKAMPQDLAIVRCSGDSMQATLYDGDWVLVDRTQRRLSREGLYAFQVGEDAWIKRISLNIKSKKIRILSDNPTTPPQPEVSEEDIGLIGRVVALVARRVP